MRSIAAAAVVLVLGVGIAPAHAVDAAPQKGRTVVLAMDASGSMAGDRMTAAKDAAEAFVSALPADVKVGLVAFANTALVRLRPTTDRSAAEAAIARMRPVGDTALRDGIIAALPDAARVVVLSDGEDTASMSSAAALVAAMDDAAVPIDVVALAPSREHAAGLRAIAARTGGTYAAAAQARDLASAFATVAAVMSAAPGSTIESSAAAARPTAPAVTAAVPVAEPPAAWLPWALAGLAALAVALLVAGLVGLRRDRGHRAGVTRALDAYVAPTTGAPSSDRGSRFVDLDQRVRARRWHVRLAERLDLAGLSLSPLAWIGVCGAAVTALGALAAALAQSIVLGLIVALSTALACHQWLHWRQGVALRSFDAELPDLLLLLASGMRSGLSFTQALEATAVEAAGEVGRQMRRVVGETRLGAPVEDALMRAADRVSSEDLRWTVQALGMQRQVGGNLSSILETAAASVRGRADLRREIRTLSAEGRLSAAILIGLPIVLFGFLALTRRDYIDFFWTSTLGLGALLTFLVIGVIGALWIRAIVRIEA